MVRRTVGRVATESKMTDSLALAKEQEGPVNRRRRLRRCGRRR